MATLGAVIEGLQILSKYDKDGVDGCISAEHDVIYAGPSTECKMFIEDVQRLDALGWHIDEKLDCWARFC